MAENAPGAEQRKFERKAVQARFSARDASGAGTLSFESADLSAGGTFLKAVLLLEPGEKLTLAFELPDGSSIQAQSRVAWVRRFPEPGQAAGMGIEFVTLEEPDRQRLQHWLGQR